LSKKEIESERERERVLNIYIAVKSFGLIRKQKNIHGSQFTSIIITWIIYQIISKRRKLIGKEIKRKNDQFFMPSILKKLGKSY
jgi:hypothetical protein